MGCESINTKEDESIKLINFQNNANPTQKKEKKYDKSKETNNKVDIEIINNNLDKKIIEGLEKDNKIIKEESEDKNLDNHQKTLSKEQSEVNQNKEKDKNELKISK